jgi:carbohydrate diacid regulator
MDLELTALLQSIKQKTNIDLTVYGAEGFVFTTAQTPLSFSEGPVAEITQKQGVTAFPIRFKKKDYTCVIAGEGEVSFNYAHLIASFVENVSDREKALTKQEELRNILLGDCNKTRIQKFVEKYGVAECGCFVLVFPASDRNEELIEFLHSYDENSAGIAILMDDSSCAFVKFADGEMQSVFRSPTEYANLLVSSLEIELNYTVNVGVGGEVLHFHEVALSYQEAATALRMAKAFTARGHVHTYREFLLVKMMEDVSKPKLKEYLNVLLTGDAASVLTDEDLMNTAEEFLANSLNLSETSRNLYMHRNTLMYRLDKIEKLTGLNIRNFDDAVSFRLITILNKILN